MGGLGGQFAGTSTDPCLYPCTKCSCRDTAFSRKVVGKSVHATIPNSTMGYDQYTVPLQLSNLLLLLSFSTRKHMSMAGLMLFFQISFKNSELKTTHNTYRDCRVHFFGQPFSKQLYIEDVSKFHQEALTITAVLAILVGPLSSFSPCPSLPSVATDDCRKHIQCLLFCLK